MIDWRAPALTCAMLLVGCASDGTADQELAQPTAAPIETATTAPVPGATPTVQQPSDATAAPEPTSTNVALATATPVPKATVIPPTTPPTDSPGPLQGGTVMVSYQGDDYPTALTGIIDSAKTDLAARTSLDDITTIGVVSVDEVVWSNAGLGCPLPGMAYAQVTIDGLRIILESNGALYDYRTGGLDEVRLCE